MANGGRIVTSGVARSEVSRGLKLPKLHLAAAGFKLACSGFLNMPSMTRIKTQTARKISTKTVNLTKPVIKG